MSEAQKTEVTPLVEEELRVPITPEVVEQHGLLPEEYQKVLEILGREPNLTELGIFSVMWSEHCAYKNSRPLLRMFPTDKAEPNPSVGRILVKAGEENAGVVDIGDGWGICFKIESHNHPSFVEPFEGAATGVGGIIRDIFTMGARPALLTNSLRFGDLESPLARRLMRGVVSGISHYGNCIGIPNIAGDVYFDKCYEGNPLVNALCLGVLRHDQIKRGAAKGVGNPVYYVGAPTGRDGLGGASFASKDLSEESHEDRPAVQKGDPFMEKLLMEACLEMMAVPDLVVGIQDMGAAGLTCSTCETASRGGAAVEIDIDLVPQREKGMNSYEIMLSESQERMLVIVQAGREHELESIFEKWDLHAVQIGKVIEGDRMIVKKGGETIVSIPAAKLADDGPVYDREAREPEYLAESQSWNASSISDLQPEEVLTALEKLLGHPTIASKEWIYRQYDHRVMADTVVDPGHSSGVIRIKTDTGEKYVSIANDCNNRYCYLNPRKGGIIAIAECMRNLVCSGATPLAMTNNLNFGNPYNPEIFYMFREAVIGLADACKHFDIPVIGGNVSLYNQGPDGAIDPTPTVSLAGLIESIDHVTTREIKNGDEVFLLLGDFPDEIGASLYLQTQYELKTGDAPDIDLHAAGRLYDFTLEQIKNGRVQAAHDISEGGLLVTLSEMLFGETTFGAELNLNPTPDAGRIDALLFGESQNRIVLAVPPTFVESVVEAANDASVPVHELGTATKAPVFNLSISGKTIFQTETSKLRSIWDEAIPAYMSRI